MEMGRQPPWRNDKLLQQFKVSAQLDLPADHGKPGLASSLPGQQPVKGSDDAVRLRDGHLRTSRRLLATFGTFLEPL